MTTTSIWAFVPATTPEKMRSSRQCTGADISVPWDAPYKIRFARRWRGLHIDVDVFYRCEENVICCVRLEDGSLSGEYFAPNAFDNLKQVPFVKNVSAPIPDPPEPVLAAIYGDWQTPREDYKSMTGPLNRIAFAPGQEIPILDISAEIAEILTDDSHENICSNRGL